MERRRDTTTERLKDEKKDQEDEERRKDRKGQARWGKGVGDHKLLIYWSR